MLQNFLQRKILAGTPELPSESANQLIDNG